MMSDILVKHDLCCAELAVQYGTFLKETPCTSQPQCVFSYIQENVLHGALRLDIDMLKNILRLQHASKP